MKSNSIQFNTVTPPEILYFNNDKVNPGQPAIFNCTVTAFPTPTPEEILLEGIPSNRKVERLQSKEMNPYLYTRYNIWKVESVKEEESVTCTVKGRAGTKSQTVKANVYRVYPFLSLQIPPPPLHLLSIKEFFLKVKIPPPFHTFLQLFFLRELMAVY